MSIGQYRLPAEPPIGAVVRLEPDDGRRWKHTDSGYYDRANWELWTRRSDGKHDGPPFQSWIELLQIAQEQPNRTVDIVGDDLLPFGTRWRTGRKLGRTVYRQIGDRPENDDVFLGIFDSAETAQLVCELVNRASRKATS